MVNRHRRGACGFAAPSSATLAGLFWRRHQARLPGDRDTIVSAGPVAAWGDLARSGMLASEPSTSRERSEPERFLRGGSPEEISSGAGLGRREAQKLGFSIGPLLFRKAPVQWKTFSRRGCPEGCYPLAQGPGDGASPQRFGNSANRRRLAVRRCRSGSATRLAGGLGAAGYAARRSGRKWPVISSNHGCRWMASARCFMRK